MVKSKASVLWVLPLLAACQEQAAAPADSPLRAPAAPEVSTASFQCESGKAVDVTVDAGRAAHVKYDNQDLTLQPEAVPTGAAYKNGQYRWVVAEADGTETARLYQAGQVIETCSRQQASAVPMPGLAPCRAEQLDLRPGETDAGMGHRQQTFEVVLKGRQSCLLPAWPAVRLEGFGTQAPPEVHHTTDSYFGPQDMSDRVTLTAERPVMFHIGWSVIPDESKGQTDCPAVTGMVVTAPGGGTLTPVAQNFEACGRGVELSPYRPSTLEPQKID